MDVFKREEEPQLVLHNRSPDCADIVLPRERLLGIGWRILDGKARIQGGGAFVKSKSTMPVIGAVPGCNNDRAGGRASGIGVFARSSEGEFLNGIGREVLEKAANPVVGIVRAIYGQVVVQT